MRREEEKRQEAQRLKETLEQQMDELKEREADVRTVLSYLPSLICAVTSALTVVFLCWLVFTYFSSSTSSGCELAGMSATGFLWSDAQPTVSDYSQKHEAHDPNILVTWPYLFFIFWS